MSTETSAPPTGAPETPPPTSEERAYAFFQQALDRLSDIFEKTRAPKEPAEPAVDLRVVWHRAYVKGLEDGESLAAGYLEQLINVGTILVRAGIVTEEQIGKHGLRFALRERFESKPKARKARKPPARRARR